LDSKTVFEARIFSDSEYQGTRNPAKVGYILTYNEADEYVTADINIKIIPTWKWLLKKS
jgi:predicted AAA+ superfamily ATPase